MAQNCMATLLFPADGTVRGLYTEAIDLALIGSLSIRRATRIEFDNASQRWRVLDMNGAPLFENHSREECLAWEQENLGEAGRFDKEDKEEGNGHQ